MTSLLNRGRRRRGGFTLVELLVVIGIISVLISILLPSLTAARRSAQSVSCLSMIRQLGLANIMYANESDGWMVPNRYRTVGSTRTVMWHGNLLYRQLMSFDPNAISAQWVWPEEYFCPSATPQNFTEVVSTGQTFPHATDSYHLNGVNFSFKGLGAEHFYGFKLTKVKWASEGMFASDNIENIFNTMQNSNNYQVSGAKSEGIAWRHGGEEIEQHRANASFLDGHAASVARSEYAFDQDPLAGFVFPQPSNNNLDLPSSILKFWGAKGRSADFPTEGWINTDPR
ncbi:MAG: type II secretion system protein [Planctomycetota bacterium]